MKNAGKKNLEMEESKKRDMTGLTAYANQALQYAAAVQAGLIFLDPFSKLAILLKKDGKGRVANVNACTSLVYARIYSVFEKKGLGYRCLPKFALLLEDLMDTIHAA